ncbi:MAG: isoprenylcysteine carboxylmethyltransferase family protein [bacterium]
MLKWLRHLCAIAVLPFSVTVLVPLWIAERNGVVLHVGTDAAEWLLQLIGLALLTLGAGFFAASLRRFAVEGQGTLAPWDPPRRIVVRGPYRYVRNPMISGVVLLLCGEAALWLSWPHALWAAAFATINLIYIPLLEEPQLARRFGASYRDYCAHVPRLMPRLQPWEPPTE